MLKAANPSRLETVSVARRRDTGEEMKITPRYPKRTKTRLEFLQDVRTAHETNNFASLQRFYMRTFDSFAELCALFKMNPNQSEARQEDPDLNMDLLYTVQDALKDMPSVMSKTVLKSIINSLLEKNKLIHDKDDVRSLFILVQSPVFASQSTFTVFAHLMNHIVSLSTKDHQLLVNWLKILEKEMFRQIIGNILQFISVQQFPTLGSANSRTQWWTATATKTLALLNAANNAMIPALVVYTEFYNSALDHIDLMQEYFNWQNPHKAENFSFCQYPFILSIIAKRYILTKVSL
uniref:Probable E3 ubiquitin-protein ligase HECTD2 n=1 Tax=Cacopsylla melanoneura TaxID=428564 RepID=A0A8D8PV11_9HEMI